jgi:hypothetical protein
LVVEVHKPRLAHADQRHVYVRVREHVLEQQTSMLLRTLVAASTGSSVDDPST